MRIILFITTIVINLSVFGRITFEQILSLEDKTYKEIQAFLYKNHSIIEEGTSYWYIQSKECNPPVYFEDDCSWKCSQMVENFILDYRTLSPPFKNTSIKNYEESIRSLTVFGEDYDSNQETALTFITISKTEKWGNINCNNEWGKIGDVKMGFSIQFNNYYHWVEFKNSVSENSEFIQIESYGGHGIPKAIYGIKRRIINNQWRGIQIYLSEPDGHYEADIYFNDYLR